MFECRVKFNEKGKIICCSQTKCVSCKDKDSCEELELYMHGPYDDINECMNQRSYKKVNRRVRQKN